MTYENGSTVIHEHLMPRQVCPEQITLQTFFFFFFLKLFYYCLSFPLSDTFHCNRSCVKWWMLCRVYIYIEFLKNILVCARASWNPRCCHRFRHLIEKTTFMCLMGNHHPCPPSSANSSELTLWRQRDHSSFGHHALRIKKNPLSCSFPPYLYSHHCETKLPSRRSYTTLMFIRLPTHEHSSLPSVYPNKVYSP